LAFAADGTRSNVDSSAFSPVIAFGATFGVVTAPAASSAVLTALLAICFDLTLFFFSAAKANPPPPTATMSASVETTFA
jgi:hypothetical protein